MNIEKKKLRVDIFNEQYLLVSDEKEAEVLKASLMVDSLMREIAEKSSLQDEKKIAVLAALRIASKLISMENGLKQCDQKYAEILNFIERVDFGQDLG